MLKDPEIVKEYFLLKNYQDNIFSMRGILLKISRLSLEQIENDVFPLGKFSGVEKVKAKSVFQLDIISKLMMYVEDLVILADSFRTKTPHYKLLDISDENQTDLGKRIGEFFKQVSSFSDNDFLKIMGYANPKDLDLQEDERKIIEINIQNIIRELRRIFKRIGDFSTTNHPAFKRFKHACCPISFGNNVKVKGSDVFSNFDSFSMVSIGEDPTQDVVAIPLSDDVLESYYILIHGIQLLLKDMLENHIACIERNIDGLIPNEKYSPKDFPKEYTEKYVKIFNEFYDKHPFDISDLKHFHFNIKADKENLKWYLELQDFLEECKKIKEENKDWYGPS